MLMTAKEYADSLRAWLTERNAPADCIEQIVEIERRHREKAERWREKKAKRIGDAREAAGLPREPQIVTTPTRERRLPREFLEERERCRERSRAYYKANREAMRAYYKERRLAKGLKTRISPEESQQRARKPIRASVRYHVLSVGRCQTCGWSVDDGATLHVDHIIPVSKGGTNARENLQALCAPCNLGKSDHYEAV